MLVHVKVAFYADGQVNARMPPYLLQHVVEEAETGGYVRLTRAIDVELDEDVRFLRLALHKGGTFIGVEVFGDFVPVVSDEYRAEGAMIGCQFFLHAFDRVVQPDAFGVQVGGKFHVCQSVAYDETIGQVVFLRQVFLEHTGARLAIGGVFFRQGRVYQDGVEYDALALQCP
ncbi:hypothetical protein Barb7_01765 [Bacteroidales bacterium Barb7]|nr:hypothetical protein Barb7_01765 [Bacteroidales bacterium Barb7]